MRAEKSGIGIAGDDAADSSRASSSREPASERRGIHARRLSRERPAASPAFTEIVPYYDALMAMVPYRMWADYTEALAARHGLSPSQPGKSGRARPTRILDLATGTGSIALELACRAYEVTGVDSSPGMIEVARDKARSRELPVRFLRQDMRRLRLEPASFDLVTCIYDSLNYLTEPRDLARAFRGVSRALRAGGLFIFDLNTAFAFAEELFAQENMSEGPVRYRWFSSYDAQARICRVDMEFWTDDGKHFREVHFQRAYTHDEIEHLLEQASLKLLDCYEAYTMLPSGKQSDRIFYVASKLKAAAAIAPSSRDARRDAALPGPRASNASRPR